jgi:GTP-binding protein YchF
MRVGIVGFRGAGKSTVFNALTGLGAGRRKKSSKPQLGVIKVADPRAEKLAGILKLEKTTHAEITLVDFAPGMGERALNPKTFQQLREVDALAHVVKCFSGPLDQAPPSPSTAIQDFESELKLTDLVVIENRLTELQKEEGLAREMDLLGRCKAQLEGEKPLRRLSLSEEEIKKIAGFGFLSQKPLLLVLNLGEEDGAKSLPKAMTRQLKKEGLLAVPLSGMVEMELVGLDEKERLKCLKDLGLDETAEERFVHCYYKLMDLISFLTHNEEEVRAWSIKRGTPALQAIAEVHADKEPDFIAIEVIQYSDLVKDGSEAKRKEAGKFRSEEKEYIVQDGDIVRFNFNE